MKRNRSKPSILLVVNKNENIEKKENVNTIEYDSRILQRIDRRYGSSYNYIIFSNNTNIEVQFNNYILVHPIEENEKDSIFMNILILNDILMQNIENIVDNGQTELAALMRYIQINNIKQNEFEFNRELRKIKEENNLGRKVVKKYKKTIVKAIKKHYSQNSITRVIKFYFKRNKVMVLFIYKILNNVEYEIEHRIKEIKYI